MRKNAKNAIFTKSGINAEYVQSMFYYEMCNHEFGINWDGTADVLSACDITMEQLNSTPELKQAWNAAKNQYYGRPQKKTAGSDLHSENGENGNDSYKQSTMGASFFSPIGSSGGIRRQNHFSKRQDRFPAGSPGLSGRNRRL